MSKMLLLSVHLLTLDTGEIFAFLRREAAYWSYYERCQQLLKHFHEYQGTKAMIQEHRIFVQAIRSMKIEDVEMERQTWLEQAKSKDLLYPGASGSFSIVIGLHWTPDDEEGYFELVLEAASAIAVKKDVPTS